MLCNQFTIYCTKNKHQKKWGREFIPIDMVSVALLFVVSVLIGAESRQKGKAVSLPERLRLLCVQHILYQEICT